LLFVNGVNRVFYHGSTYTPKDAPWPGWLFYASIMVNPNNSIFRDMSALNVYITRVQSFLQQGSPDNELLLYFPIFDIWEKYRKGNYVAFEIHKLEDKLPHFEETVDEILRLGYDLDYISDSQLQQTSFRDGSLQTPGGSYRSILVPDCQVMPLETLQQLLKLASQGARVMFLGQLPDEVPGLFQADERKAAMKQLWQQTGVDAAGGALQIHPYGQGCLMTAASLEELLPKAGLSRESLSADYGARLIRRRLDDGSVYFVSMLQNRSIDGWVGLGHEFADLCVFNPMTGETGRAVTRLENGQKQLYLQLQPGESVILRCYDKAVAEAPLYPAYAKAGLKGKQAVRYGEGIPLEGKWQFEFTEGAPAIDGRFTMTGEPTDWTRLTADSAKAYAGAGRYTLSFKLPKIAADDWCLDFGNGLYESARVYVNGQDAGRVWALPYRLNVGRFLKPGKKNLIEIEVTNMPANRIADYDRRGVDWRIFKDINIVSVFYKPITFDVWETVPGGLTETPRLMPLRTINN
ncbi:MAG: glycosyl hydrolase family 2, partial [Bacteroidales bacterium]|nr:glycosyl hydrolase family 2 [Bacteroidales bacterium]